jgi:hypothetical protein
MALGPITGSPTSTNSASANPPIVAAYVSGSYKRSMSVLITQTNGNIAGGFNGMLHTGIGRFQTLINPYIPKDSTKTLALSFEVPWARKT